MEVLARRPSEGRDDFPREKEEPSAVVVSHRKDADGLSSAVLIRHLTGSKVFLTDYSDLDKTLREVPEAKDVFVCDLGLNKSTFDDFLFQLKRLNARGRVHYFDHHPLDAEFLKRLQELGIDVVHSTQESASVLVYMNFQGSLSHSPAMKIIACCGAITDYLDLQPFAKKLISSFDRQFLLYEATVLSFSIAMIGREDPSSNSRLVKIVEELAEGKLPHEMENASSYAQEFASRSANLMSEVRREGKKMKNFAYFKTKESSTGNVANFLMGAFNVPVGVALREEEPGYYEISMRGSVDSGHNLGQIARKISDRFDTSGGGHSNAAGARIKVDQFEEFLQLLEEELSKTS